VAAIENPRNWSSGNANLCGGCFGFTHTASPTITVGGTVGQTGACTIAVEVTNAASSGTVVSHAVNQTTSVSSTGAFHDPSRDGQHGGNLGIGCVMC
jgi:hypothetical protein